MADNTLCVQTVTLQLLPVNLLTIQDRVSYKHDCKYKNKEVNLFVPL